MGCLGLRRLMLRGGVGLVLLPRLLLATAPLLYQLDQTWSPAFPEGADSFSAVDVSGDEVFVSQRSPAYPQPILVLSAASGRLRRSFGAGHIGMNASAGGGGNHGLRIERRTGSEDTLWVMDFTNHSVLSFSLDGRPLGRAGGPTVDERRPEGFGNVADAAFHEGVAYFADGDGGAASRVESWSASSGAPEQLRWVWPAEPQRECGIDKQPPQRQEYCNPHSLDVHGPSGKLLVADRDHSRLVVADPASGAALRELDCPQLGLGPKGQPFGVRFLGSTLFVAVADARDFRSNQYLHVAEVDDSLTRCSAVRQSLPVDPEVCHTPHLMGVEPGSGDVYLACVKTPHSNVLRFTQSRQPSASLVV